MEVSNIKNGLLTDITTINTV